MLSMIASLGWLGMGFMGLWMLLPLGLVLGAMWLGGRALGNGGSDGRRPRRDELDAILRRRFASGEIDFQQYRQAREALGLRDAT
jgi:uncharacterized membrane protein